MAEPLATVAISVKSGVPLPVGLLYRLNVTVPVGAMLHDCVQTVAVSWISPPTSSTVWTWLVKIGGISGSASGGGRSGFHYFLFGWIPFLLVTSVACLPGLGLLVWIVRLVSAREE